MSRESVFFRKYVVSHVIFKVIVSLITDHKIRKVMKIANESRSDYFKTFTGFLPCGVSYDDLVLFKKNY